MITGVRVTEAELRELLVDRLDIVTPEDFAATSRLAARQRLPLERALSERCRVPMRFLLEQLAQHWSLAFTDLKVTDIKPEALQRVREDYARSHTLIPFDAIGG